MSRLDGFDHGKTASVIHETSLMRHRDFAMVTFSATITLALEVRRAVEPDLQLIQAIAESEKTLKRVQSDNKLARHALAILQELRDIP
jgi:hypothetical protein